MVRKIVENVSKDRLEKDLDKYRIRAVKLGTTNVINTNVQPWFPDSPAGMR